MDADLALAGAAITDPAARIAACRAQMTAMAALWRDTARRSARAVRQEAEAQVFNQMVVALHRWLPPDPRTVAEVGDPLTELRLLARGVSEADGWFPADAMPDWRPEASITGHAPGDRIRLTEPLFSRLTEACLARIAAA